jgi:hypothetical protein
MDSTNISESEPPGSPIKISLSYLSQYKKTHQYFYEYVTVLKLDTDNNKPIHGKLYSMYNLKVLYLQCIKKKSIDIRLLRLVNLTSLTLKNCAVDRIVIDSLGVFTQLEHLEFDLYGEHLPECIYGLSNLQTLSVSSLHQLEIPLEINHLSKLKNLTINAGFCNIGGLFELNKYSKFKDNDTENQEYHVYGHSMVIFNYVDYISIPTNIKYFNVLGSTYFINNLPSHIKYLRINDCRHVSNLPFGLEELHIRKKCAKLNSLKIPFGCKVYVEDKLIET